MNIALDNDVFSKITSSKTNTLKLIEQIKSKKYILNIPSETIRQSFHGGKFEFVSFRFANLSLLLNEIGIDNFRLTGQSIPRIKGIAYKVSIVIDPEYSGPLKFTPFPQKAEDYC